jgi:hypothetical protein
LTFIGHLQQLQSPARNLKFLDHAFVTEDEIIRGLKELGHSASDREMFRFNSIVFGRNGQDPACQSLNLSNRKLQRGDFSRFPHLTQLDLSKNLYNDESLLASRLPSLTRLTELNLMDNQIKSMRLLAAMIQAMPSVRRLRVTGNPGYSGRADTEKSRRHLLAYFTNVHMTSFRLDFLNSMQISIDERIEALCHAKANWTQMHPPNVLDRMRSGDLHSFVAREAMSPAHHYKEDDEKKQQYPLTPPPNVGNGPNPSPSAASSRPAAGSTAAALPTTTTGMSAAGVLASPRDAAQMAAMASTEDEIIRHGGAPLSLEDDIVVQAENARFILTAAQQGLVRSMTEFGSKLHKKGLRLLGGTPLGISSFVLLRVLDLRENHLSDLSTSGIERLPYLTTLDVRANEFPTLEALVVSLRPCNALKNLFIQYATRNNDETASPVSFTPAVFGDLRGLERCDEVDNGDCVLRNPLLVSALNVLWKLARIGPNNLRRVDLSNKCLPGELFYPVLSALHALGITELLGNTGGHPRLANEWLKHPNYSDVIILGLGPKFCWLDGVAITDQRRMLAFRVDKGQRQFHGERAYEAVRCGENRCFLSACVLIHVPSSFTVVHFVLLQLARRAAKSQATFLLGLSITIRFTTKSTCGWQVPKALQRRIASVIAGLGDTGPRAREALRPQPDREKVELRAPPRPRVSIARNPSVVPTVIWTCASTCPTCKASTSMST